MQRCYQQHTPYTTKASQSASCSLRKSFAGSWAPSHQIDLSPATTLHHTLVSHPVRHHRSQVADCLAKVARQVTAAAADAVKREGLLAGVAELGAAREEAAWLTAYEQDDDRYKASPKRLHQLAYEAMYKADRSVRPGPC